MDRTSDSVTNPLLSSGMVVDSSAPLGTSPSDLPEANAVPRDSVNATEQPDSASEPRPRAPTPPPAIDSAEDVEHAYWAEFEEDTTTPDEEEFKEIEGSDTDYSACDRRFS